jgi:hypothetical protein
MVTRRTSVASDSGLTHGHGQAGLAFPCPDLNHYFGVAGCDTVGQLRVHLKPPLRLWERKLKLAIRLSQIDFERKRSRGRARRVRIDTGKCARRKEAVVRQTAILDDPGPGAIVLVAGFRPPGKY